MCRVSECTKITSICMWNEHNAETICDAAVDVTARRIMSPPACAFIPSPSFIGSDVLREQTSDVIVSTDTDDLSMGWIGSIGDWMLVGLYAADISLRGFVVIRQMRSIIQRQSTSSWSDTTPRLRRLSKYRASDGIITINKRWRIQLWGNVSSQ